MLATYGGQTQYGYPMSYLDEQQQYMAQNQQLITQGGYLPNLTQFGGMDQFGQGFIGGNQWGPNGEPYNQNPGPYN